VVIIIQRTVFLLSENCII